MPKNEQRKENTLSPLVTVYMPTHNRVDLLQRAVDSVLNQDYKNIELIVVDDNSEDGTSDYLAVLAQNESRLKYFKNDFNLGACSSRNKAIFSAKGEFITGLDDDDYFLSNHISSLLNAWMVRREDTVAIYPELKRKTVDGVRDSQKKIERCKFDHLIHANWIGNQVFTKTENLIKIGGFDVDFPAWQDLDCWYRLLKKSGMYAESTRQYTYVMDVSHPHERITNKKAETIRLAHEIFCDKHNLNEAEIQISEIKLTNYTKSLPKLSSCIKRVFSFPRWINLRSVLISFYIGLGKL